MPIINLLDFGNADTMFLKDPSNLRINSETSQIVEAETCHLTWNAAEVDPPQDITYYITHEGFLVDADEIQSLD